MAKMTIALRALDESAAEEMEKIPRRVMYTGTPYTVQLFLAVMEQGRSSESALVARPAVRWLGASAWVPTKIGHFNSE